MSLRKLLSSLAPGALVLAAVAGLLAWPEQTHQAVQDALRLCGSVLLPALFPFFVVSDLVVGLGLATYPARWLEKWMRPLFGLGGSCAAALVLGAIGGYPVGAKTTAQLVRQGQCTPSEGQRLLLFCNNAGPAFFLSVVGVGVFGSLRLGLLLWGTHLAGALLVGLLQARLRRETEQNTRSGPTAPPPAASASALTRAVANSAAGGIQVCAYVIVFGVLLVLLRCSGLLGRVTAVLAGLGLPPIWGERLLTGMVELSNGVADLPAAAASAPLAAFLLGWGGVCVHCQTLSVVEEAGLRPGGYLLAKLAQGGIAAGLTAAAMRLLPCLCPAWSALSGQSRVVMEAPLRLLLLCCAWGGLALLLLLLLTDRERPE